LSLNCGIISAEIKRKSKKITFNFPGEGGSFQSGVWIFENGRLLKERELTRIGKVQERQGEKFKSSPIVPEGYDKPGPQKGTPGYFTIGSTEDEVLAVQGTPTGVAYGTWNYGIASVTFENGRVKSYHNFSNILKVNVANKKGGER
jgi:hypothetical protein